MRGCAVSPDIDITTCPWTWAAVTSTCATMRRPSSGLHRGSRRTTNWRIIPAATAWATRQSALLMAASRLRPATLCRWMRTLKSGSSRSPTTARKARIYPPSPPSSSACGTRRTMPPTSSATSIPARWRWKAASFITRRNTASAVITSPTLPARSRAPDSTHSARRFSAAIAVGTSRPPWKPAN